MTTAPARVVGIDGGATRTRYLLADATGGILARSEGKGSLLGAGEDRSVADDLVREVGTLASRAGTGLPVDALCAGLAGAARRPDARALLGDRLSQLGVSRRVRIVPDAEVAFVDAFGEAAGILLIAGTGSIGLGRAGGGELERVGGWGALLGDEGSGYRIGLDGLQAAIRGAERRGPPTGLSDTLFRSLGLESVARVLEWGQGAGKSRIAALAPLVIQEAERGDAVAVEIVDRAGGGARRARPGAREEARDPGASAGGSGGRPDRGAWPAPGSGGPTPREGRLRAGPAAGLSGAGGRAPGPSVGVGR